jgi:hypothetical protein
VLSLFVYVDGYDLAEVEDQLVDRLKEFVIDWGISTARVVNDKLERTPDLSEDDLPVWNMGLNFAVDKLPRDKIQELVRFLSTLAKETGREFVIGHWDHARRISSDWCSIGPQPKQDTVEFLAKQIQA